MKRNYRSILFAVALVVTCLSSFAQYVPANSEHLILKYPNSNQVVLKQQKTYVISKVKDDLDIKLNTVLDLLITKSGGFNSNSEELKSDSSYMELVDFDAYSLIVEKEKYKKKKVKQFFLNDEFERNFFTNDTKTTQFYFPNTDAMVITHLEYELKLKDPKFLPPVFFQSFQPMESMDFKIIVDNDVNLKFQFFYLDSSKLKHTKTVGKRTTEHLWELSEVPEINYYSNAPNVKWYLPHIVFKIEGYETENGYKTILSDIGDLYELYQSWIEEIEQEDGSQLQAVLDKILEGAESDLDKLKRIYKWVQTNIKYIAFADGMEGFVPRSSHNVLNSRFGDCKGMTNLMYNMAKKAGVKTQRTWIGSRDIPYSYDTLASPFVDNHMILAYLFDDSVIFLDATSSETPFGYPTEFIQGKQALLGIDANKFELKFVPIVSSDKNMWSDTVYAKIEGKDLIGNGRVKMSGYHSVRWQQRIKQYDEQGKLEFVTGYLEKGDNRFTVNEYTQHVSTDGEHTQVEYSFRIPDYVVPNDGEVYLNLNLNPVFGSNPIDEDRTVPIEMNFSTKSHSVVILELEDDFSPSHIPDNSNFVDDKFSYSMDYKVTSNNIIFDLQTYSVDLIMKPENFDRWNKLSEKFRRDARKNLVLKKQK